MQSSNSMTFPHSLQCPAVGFDQHRPRKNAPQWGQRFVEKTRIAKGISNAIAISMSGILENRTPTTSRTAIVNNRINAALYFFLLAYFFI